MSDTIRYSHKEIRTLALDVIRQMIARKFTPDVIVCVARGGLVPGVYFSQFYGVDLICLTIDPHKQPYRNIALHQMADALRTGQKVLLVDEICDKGTTLRNICDKIHKMCPEMVGQEFTVAERNLHTAVLIHNVAEDLFSPDYIGEEINKFEDPSWIVFDWESWWN